MITVYTDGSCLGNPGLGGMGMVVVDNDIAVLQLGIPSNEITTNNRMELNAVIEILKRLYDYDFKEVHIITDSNYVVKGSTEWRAGWLKKNFKNVKNVDLWKELYNLLNDGNITFHDKDKFNNMADNIAVEAATTQLLVQR